MASHDALRGEVLERRLKRQHLPEDDTQTAQIHTIQPPKMLLCFSNKVSAEHCCHKADESESQQISVNSP